MSPGCPALGCAEGRGRAWGDGLFRLASMADDEASHEMPHYTNENITSWWFQPI